MQYGNIEQAIADVQRQISNAPNDITKKALEKLLGQLYEAQRTQQPYNKMGDLSEQLLDPNSQFYQNYQSYLQKTMPGIGVNTLLAPLMAGGVTYAGGQNIASAKATELNKERQDKINTGVQGFALQNIGAGAGLLGQQGNLGLGIAELNEQRRQYNETQSGNLLQSLGGILGTGLGLLNPFNLFGGGKASATSNSGGGVAGYGG